MFNRAYYLSGAYGLWRPVLIVGRGAVGSFLYYFMVTALNTDIDAKYKKTKLVQRLCGIFTVTAALAIHLWSATPAWFTAYLGPRVGAETAVAAVTAYQEDMLLAILPMYNPDGTDFRDPFCDAADRQDPLSPPDAPFSSGHMDVRYEPKQHKHRHRDPAHCGSNL